MLRFGKSKTESLRALARLLNLKKGNELAIFVIWYVTARERKAVKKMQRQMLSTTGPTASIILGPARTPLKAWTEEQAEAYKRARLQDSEQL